MDACLERINEKLNVNIIFVYVYFGKKRGKRGRAGNIEKERKKFQSRLFNRGRGVYKTVKGESVRHGK